MTSGPMGPATDLLGEVRFQLLMLNEQVRNLVELEQRELPTPQVTVEPAPVILPATTHAAPLDLRPLLESLAALDRQGDREELQALRKEFTDLATAIRHIAGSQSVGSGSSFVTAQTRNEPGQTLHVTVDALPVSGAATDVSDRAARLLGHVTVDTMPTVAVNNFPATQPVSIASMPTTPVTGTFFQSTQPVSLATNTPDVTDRSARLLGHVTVDSAPTTAITAASLPLPTGAALDATLTGGTQKAITRGGAKGSTAAADVTSVAVDANTQALHANVTNFPATQPVSGTFFQATQPVSLATNTPDVTDRSARLLGHVTVDSAPTTAVTGTFWQATQPVSLAANQSVNNAQVNGAAVVTSATGVQDVMPRKRTGATGLSPNYSASHITTNTTTNVTAATGYVSTIVIVVSGIGSAWTIKILNKEATAKTLYPATTAALGVVQFNFSEPVLMTSGIDIVTAGTTAGIADVFVTYWQ